MSRPSMHYCWQNYYKKMLSCYFVGKRGGRGGRGAGEGGRRRISTKATATKMWPDYFSYFPIQHSRRLSSLHCQTSNFKIFWRSRETNESSQGRSSTYALQNLPILDFCSVDSNDPVTSRHPSLPAYALCFLGLSTRPGCRLPPSAKCQKYTAFLQAWFKSHLFRKGGGACHSLPSSPMTWNFAHLPVMWCDVVNVVCWWKCPLLTCSLSKGMEWVCSPHAVVGMK